MTVEVEQHAPRSPRARRSPAGHSSNSTAVAERTVREIQGAVTASSPRSHSANTSSRGRLGRAAPRPRRSCRSSCCRRSGAPRRRRRAASSTWARKHRMRHDGNTSMRGLGEHRPGRLQAAVRPARGRRGRSCTPIGAATADARRATSSSGNASSTAHRRMASAVPRSVERHQHPIQDRSEPGVEQQLGTVRQFAGPPELAPHLRADRPDQQRPRARDRRHTTVGFDASGRRRTGSPPGSAIRSRP